VQYPLSNTKWFKCKGRILPPPLLMHNTSIILWYCFSNKTLYAWNIAKAFDFLRNDKHRYILNSHQWKKYNNWHPHREKNYMGPQMSKCTKSIMAWDGISLEMGEKESLWCLPILQPSQSGSWIKFGIIGIMANF
jgi:hypothetical protein